MLVHVPPLAIRTLILYVAVLVAMRWTGKRTLSAMAPFDLALIIMISEVAAIPITTLEVDLLHGLLPVFLLGTLHVLLTTLNLHYRKLEDLTEGKPTLLIQDGQVLRANLLRERVSLADLASVLRTQQVRRLDQVEEAWLEPTGAVSVILRPAERPLTRTDLAEFGREWQGPAGPPEHLDRSRDAAQPPRPPTDRRVQVELEQMLRAGKDSPPGEPSRQRF